MPWVLKAAVAGGLQLQYPRSTVVPAACSRPRVCAHSLVPSIKSPCTGARTLAAPVCASHSQGVKGDGAQADSTGARNKEEEDSKEPRRMEVAYDPKGTMERYAMACDPDRAQRGPASLALFSPSKVNVFLRVTQKRVDGYHDLASLFHTISLGDVLKFSVSPSQTRDSLTTTAPGVPLDGSNLIIKALNLFRHKTGIKTFFWVHLEKRVPTGAGLGGGSGNAATALWAANQMTGGTVDERQLQEWSAEIGSDVPFFFSHGAAYCTGRGEVVQDLHASLSLSDPLVLMKPKEACSTAEVYRKFSLDRASQEAPETLLQRVLEEGISQATCVNDLEAPAFEVLPSLRSFKSRVSTAGRSQYSAVFMSGSGSTIVGVGDYEAPSFVYDEEEYKDVFVSEASFIKRSQGQWYQAVPVLGANSDLSSSMGSREDARQVVASELGRVATGVGQLTDLKLPFSFEA